MLEMKAEMSILSISRDIVIAEMSVWPDGKIRNDNTPEWNVHSAWKRKEPLKGHIYGLGGIKINISASLKPGDTFAVMPGDMEWGFTNFTYPASL